jgi:putative peptidoglycan lipid II flippase
LSDSVDESPRTPRFVAAAAILAASVMLSRVLGFVREAVLADRVGAGAEMDAYSAGFQLPDLLNYFLAGGALSIAFIPMYTRVRGRGGEAAAARLFALVLGTVGAIAVLATLALWWWADVLIALQFPRFDPDTRALTVRLTRIVLPAQVFFVTGGIVRAVLMARDRFATQALTPVIYNLGIIAAGLAFAEDLGVEGFAWGALGGAVVGALLVPLADAHWGARLKLGLRIAPLDPDLWRYLLVAAPLMLGLSLLTVDEWYERWFGGLLETGTIAQLRYARQLMLAPVAVAGQAIATAALPTLSRLWAEKRIDELDAIVLDTLRAGFCLAALGGAALFALAEPIVVFVYQHGRFTVADTEIVAALLRIFSFAVPGWILQQIAVRAFFARGDTWRPMLLATAVALLAIPLYLALGPRFGAAGLAAAGVIAMSSNALLTLLFARGLHGAPRLVSLVNTALRALLIAAIAALAAALAIETWLTGAASLFQLSVGGLAFGIAALLGARWIGDPPIREVVARLASLRRKSGRSRG